MKLTKNQLAVLSALCEAQVGVPISALQVALRPAGIQRSSIQSALNGLQLRGYAGVRSAGSPMTYVPTEAGRLALEATSHE